MALLWDTELLIDNLKTKLIISSLSIIGILISSVLFSGIAGAEQQVSQTLDYTEGGHLDTDFNTFFLSEWWYLNAKATLRSTHNDVVNIGFFLVFGHAETPMFMVDGVQLSQMSAFHGLYLSGRNTEFEYADTFLPQALIGNLIALHTPYVSYIYPEGVRMLQGSAAQGYSVNYIADNLEINAVFLPMVDKTIDESESPLDFIVFERAYGVLQGTVVLHGETYDIVSAEGYFDHMIPISRGLGTWPMEIHGWNWLEVTTEDYQAVLYGIRSLEDRYHYYSYKHLTILDKHTGKVVAEYSGDDITIRESGWKREADFNMWHPSRIVVSTTDGTVVSVNAQQTIIFDTPYDIPAGFVDFMSYQSRSGTIRYQHDIQHGSSFSEYLVSDLSVLAP